MLTIKEKKIDGFSEILDWGEVPGEAAIALDINSDSHFIVMTKFNFSLKDVLFNNEMSIQCFDSVKIGI